MTSRQLLIALFVLIALGVVVVFARTLVGQPVYRPSPSVSVTVSPTPTPTPTNTGTVFCTMDAMMCPDGSYVGRVPPSCQFAACPAQTPKPGAKLFRASIGEKIVADSVAITLLEIVEDSRCPQGVQCIQAGTVRVRGDVAAPNIYVQRTFKLNEPLVIGGTTITLVDVTPLPRSGIRIDSADYRFTFEIKK
jgi:hypothetical protein